MNELRWILIGFGIVLLAGIYLWGRRGARAVAPDEAGRARPEAALHAYEPWDSGMPSCDAPPGGDAAAAGEPMISASRRAYGHETPTEELPVRPDAAAPAPTLSSSESPQPRRIERRKILSLRLAASPQRLDGAKLLEVLGAESLQHGRYKVFHRLHQDGVSIFSIASMVEPGAFEIEEMPQTHYPGITLFAQLPGPVPGMHALNELVACARKLQQALGGVLQDDRGVPLTVHRIERLRQEVREFERPPGTGVARGGSPHSLTS